MSLDLKHLKNQHLGENPTIFGTYQAPRIIRCVDCHDTFDTVRSGLWEEEANTYIGEVVEYELERIWKASQTQQPFSRTVFWRLVCGHVGCLQS